jgi:hypothetical protein
LITLFGHTTSVASVGALSRLAQIFVLFAQMNPLLLEPYFARLSSTRLKRNYLGILAVEGIFCLVVVGLAYKFPQLFLWILGHKYSGLRFEVFLMIASSSVAYFSGVLWVIHCARRFVYWWNGMAVIILTLAVQALFLWKVDLSTVRSVLILNLATMTISLLVNVLAGIYGFVRGPRKAASVTAVPAGHDYL